MPSSDGSRSRSPPRTHKKSKKKKKHKKSRRGSGDEIKSRSRSPERRERSRSRDRRRSRSRSGDRDRNERSRRSKSRDRGVKRPRERKSNFEDVASAPVGDKKKKTKKTGIFDKTPASIIAEAEMEATGRMPASMLSAMSAGSHQNDRNQQGQNNDFKGDEKAPKVKPNYEKSGALAKEDGAKGEEDAARKYAEPVDAHMPDKNWRLYPFKGDKKVGQLIRLHRTSHYLIGKDRKLCTIPMLHPSISKQHAVIQFRRKMIKGELRISPYIIDLDSTNGTYLNGKRIDSSRYYQLLQKDVLKFAYSSRDHVLLHTEMVADSEI